MSIEQSSVCRFNHMDTLIQLLREKRRTRAAELSALEIQQEVEHTSRRKELEELKDKTHQYVETITGNLNIVTGHRHAISKAVHELKQSNGLPISNKHHKQALDFSTDAITFLNNETNFNAKGNTEKVLDGSKLNSDVQSCAQSSLDVYKGMQSSVEKLETLMQYFSIMTNGYNGNDFETSIFDEY